jgi:hypothetical protein
MVSGSKTIMVTCGVRWYFDVSIALSASATSIKFTVDGGCAGDENHFFG